MSKTSIQFRTIWQINLLRCWGRCRYLLWRFCCFSCCSIYRSIKGHLFGSEDITEGVCRAYRGIPSYYYKIEAGLRRPSRKIYQRMIEILNADPSASFPFDQIQVTMSVNKNDWLEGIVIAQNLSYTKCGDYLIPDIKLQHTSEQMLGKYGRMRRAFLKEHQPMLFSDMVLAEILFPHLWEIQQTCERRMELLMSVLLVGNPAPDKHLSSLRG